MKNKYKLFAYVFGLIIGGSALVVYAESVYTRSFDLPVLLVTVPEQPAPGLAPAGALKVPFTNVNLTARGGDIVINEITVKRTGFAVDSVFDEIVLLDDGGEELGEGTLNSEHLVHFTEPIEIPRDTTLRLTVAANMAEEMEGLGGQMPSLTIMGITASGVLKLE